MHLSSLNPDKGAVNARRIHKLDHPASILGA
jgi:hypothetical protein